MRKWKEIIFKKATPSYIDRQY